MTYGCLVACVCSGPLIGSTSALGQRRRSAPEWDEFRSTRAPDMSLRCANQRDKPKPPFECESKEQRAHHIQQGLVGENAMRFVLELCLVFASCASANAAPRWHHNSRQAIARPGQVVTPSYITPGGVRIYRDDSVPGGLRTDHDDPPAYDDPSKFGGG
jgi:hypothetical protein